MGIALLEALQSFLNSVPDASLLVINSSDGGEVAMASKGEGSDKGGEDLELLTALVPRFIMGSDTATRLNLGNTQYSITWAGRRVLLHMLILKKLRVTMLLEENANLGLIDEHMSMLTKLLEKIIMEGNEEAIIPPEQEESEEEVKWYVRWKNNILEGMDYVGAIVSSLMGLEDSLFQDVVDSMTHEDYVNAMKVKAEREAQDEAYEAELKLKEEQEADAQGDDPQDTRVTEDLAVTEVELADRV